MSKKQWEERFSWFWYNAKEVFHSSQEELEEKAKAFADAGITTIMSFTGTHERLGFYPYWKEINDCIARIVKACHKYGIKVIEHHSSELVHNLRNSIGWARLEEDIGSFSNWESTPEDWPKIIPFLAVDPEIDGSKLLSWRQIDGRTGKPVNSVYNTHCMCYNNPDYRRVYFSYLKDVIKTGVDGIMNDDVQYFADSNACTCEHCRRLFKEQTGYDIPDPEHWEEFFDDYENPAFVAWKRFRYESTERFYRDIFAMYDELGYQCFYPNYSSDVLKHVVTAYPFERAYDLWSYMFQENCFSAVIRESYFDFACEAVQRYAMADRKGVPSMSMFYPDRDDSLYFSFALAKSWGQLYTATAEGVDLYALEKKYRDFEKAHMDLFAEPKKLANVAFYYSRDTRDFTYDATNLYQFPLLSSMEAAIVSNLGVDMVLEESSVEELSKKKCIVASHCAGLSDEQIANLKAYVEAGGKLVIYGEFARFASDGGCRSSDEIARMIGVKSKVVDSTYQGGVSLSYQGKSEAFTLNNSTYAFEGDACILTATDGSCRGISEKVGQGEIVWIAGVVSENQFQPTVWAMRRREIPERVNSAPFYLDILRDTTGRLLKCLAGAEAEVVTENKELLVTAYGVEEGYAVHIVNIADTVSREIREIGHEDIIPNFVASAAKLPEITVRVALPCEASNAVLYTPENDGAIEVSCKNVGDGWFELTVPANAFAGYGLISVK